MTTLHFDCFSGVSGDMTLAALIDAGVDVQSVRDGLNSLGLPIELCVDRINKAGFAATQVKINAPHEHEHRHLHHIEEIVCNGALTNNQCELAMRIFQRLAKAEAAAHGMAIEKVHFHEVGALDSIADIAGVAIALDVLQAERITCTPVPTGSGMVQCAHGLMPVPAPGTAELLKGVPLRPCSIEAELTTPTGAAILTTIVQEWTATPDFTVEHIGYGAGQKDFAEQPNLLRVFVGETHGNSTCGTATDQVWVLETNLDDVSPEMVGYCHDQLLAAGALDVFTVPIFMKKNRPGIMLTVLTPECAKEAALAILFRETTTLGVRQTLVQRQMLKRKNLSIATPWGPIQAKLAWRDGLAPRLSPEYEDCARIARRHNIALREVYQAVHLAFAKSKYADES